MGVGMNLKEILRDKKMTIKQLSESSGISLNTLYSITKRDSERVDNIIIQRLADALDVSVLDLLGANTLEDRQLVEQEARRTGKSVAEVEREDARDILDAAATERLLAALKASDPAIVQVFSDIPDEDIMAHLDSIIADELTRDGRILTLKRAYELSNTPGYGRFAAQSAPQLPAAVQKGTDTTPAPDGAEGAQKGK